MFHASVEEKDNGMLEEIRKAVAQLKDMEVLVGIPAEDSAQNASDGVNNAELLYIHTNGSPVSGIPPRPVLEPSIAYNVEKIAAAMKEAADEALKGNREALMPKLEETGMVAQNAARDWFTNPANGWAPNHPATIRKKKSSRPLIDRAELRKAITYKVKKVSE